MSLESAKIMGSIFFTGRLILAIVTGIFPGLVCKLLLTQLSSEDFQFCKILGLVIPIGFGIGALTDLILVIGAHKKSTGALYFWSVANIFLGGIICWAMILHAILQIPLVAKKAIKEIKQEEDGYKEAPGNPGQPRPKRRPMY